jgi:oligopeptide/dipeptide ABC transporter ATP-binding protein
MTLLSVANLTVSYRQGWRKPPFRAVRGISFEVGRGETVSIVGESGSGKSTIGGAILGLRNIESGQITFQGEDITHAGVGRRRELAQHIQAIFQDPFSSLDPKHTVGESVGEPLTVGPRVSKQTITEAAARVLSRVGIPRNALTKFPVEFSGGQRQRISIARAIVRTPELIVCDEAVSALDVSVQAHVLNLLAELNQESGTSYLFISHNMAVVRHISDRVIVLYQGRVMEEGSAIDVCDDPAHPYTRSLIAAVPVPDVEVQARRRAARAANAGMSGMEAASSEGCPFAPRCPHVVAQCSLGEVESREFAPGRKAACLRVDEVRAMPNTASIGL